MRFEESILTQPAQTTQFVARATRTQPAQTTQFVARATDTRNTGGSGNINLLTTGQIYPRSINI